MTASINGHTATAVTVHVPGVGPWWADVELEGAPELAGRVTIAIGALELSGTIDPSHSGTFGLQRRMRIVAGAGGWGTLLAPRHYHNDAQVRARVVAEDAAREAGETLAAVGAVDPAGALMWAPASERIGLDYVRSRGPASRALEGVIGGVSWWVDYDGTTRVGARASSRPVEGSYDVLEVVADERTVVLAVDDPGAVVIGSELTARLDAPETVRELEIQVTGTEMRLRAWCGGESGARGRVAGAFRDLVNHITGEKLWGLWRYRVIRQPGAGAAPARLELQSVRSEAGVPNTIAISLWPGMPGGHAAVQLGSEVLVQFVEGDRRFPVVTHFAGVDGAGHVPVHAILSASSTVRLGSADASDGVALSSRCDDRHDKVAGALDALCSTAPIPNDGGAALQAAVRLAWAPDQPGVAGVPPVVTAPADVGSDKVLADA